ncbi:MAG: DUF3106 domain-containing protein [Acidobacteria bacterium]|nr:DUF3106 domain-containing protein [Acidobacteriota bacterium]
MRDGHISSLTERMALRLALLSLCLAVPATAQHGSQSSSPHQQGAPQARDPYSGQPVNPQVGRFGPFRNGPGQKHLPEWLAEHQNLTVQEQEKALRNEPGFARLPAQQQQRLINRLYALDSRPPEQRARILQRMENMERLSPEQRAEVRGAAQGLAMMPPDRQHMVKRTLRELRDLPPEERQSALASPYYEDRFSPQERTILGNLLKVEPYNPPDNDLPSPEQPH